MLPFGKYKGKQITDVFIKDKKYIDWLVTTDWYNKKFPELTELSNKLIKEYNENIIYNDYIIIYTDGACSRNGQIGAQCGIGIHFSEKNPIKLKDVSKRLNVEVATNNVAELSAIDTAINMVIDNNYTNYKIEIYTDSRYSIDCVEKWYKMWVKKNNLGKKNIEIIKNIYDNIQNLRFKFKYIKAHTNLSDEHSMGNANADQLATNSLKKY